MWPLVPAVMLIGLVYHFIGWYFDLFILFPVLAGAGVGSVLVSLSKKHKVRSKPVLVTLAVVGGLTCFAARWVGNAVHTREVFIAARTATLSAANPAMAPTIEAMVRRAYSPARFLPLYIRARAHQGTTLGVSSSPRRSSATGGGFWALTLFNAILMCGAAWSVTALQANQPFCTDCDEWHCVELTASRLLPGQATEAARLAGEGNFAALGELPTQGATGQAHCDVIYTKCPGCAMGWASVKRSMGGKIKILWSGAISPSQMEQLEAVRAGWLA